MGEGLLYSKSSGRLIYYGEVYSLTPGLNWGASDGFVVLVPLVIPVA
jgi:hypothetical protein